MGEQIALFDNHATSQGNHALAYVLLFGDATVDFRNNASTQLDGVPTNLILITRSGRFTYATDDIYALLDAADNFGGQGYMDVALGRIPAETTEEANVAVDKIVAYETAAPQETWRKEVVLVADDTRASGPGSWGSTSGCKIVQFRRKSNDCSSHRSEEESDGHSGKRRLRGCRFHHAW